MSPTVPAGRAGRPGGPRPAGRHGCSAGAKHTDTAASDLDLFVVSDTLTHPDLINALLCVEAKLMRQINSTIYSSAEFKQKADLKNAFLMRVLEQPKIWVIGDEHDL